MRLLDRLKTSRINTGFASMPVWGVIALALIAAPVTTFAQNMDCTLIVPPNPLTAAGLATPYQFVATNPANGPCHEANPMQSAFVQGAVIDIDTGQISVYNPLVIDKGTKPAAATVVPKLPAHSIVALWFGYNANNLTLVGSNNDLKDSHCTQNLGQFAYCNAHAFFEEANDQIAEGKLIVPALGTSPKDHQVCPTVRSFVHVDQDQSDNVTTIYLFKADGTVAQNTAKNRAIMGLTAKGNPSDNRLLDVFIDAALGCTPWTVSDLADPGTLVPALPLNELQAAKFQKAPVARVSLGDPFTFSPPITGTPNLDQVNRYRRGVDQQRADDADDASAKTYCQNIRDIHTDKLILDRAFLTAFRSPDPAAANSLFTFMAQRYVATYQLLKCQALLGLPVNVTVVTNAAGVATAATIQ